MILDIHKFQKSQKIKFKNNSLLTEALTHKSANKKFNNQISEEVNNYQGELNKYKEEVNKKIEQIRGDYKVD